MQKIKTIIFDLGGIFINIDYPKTEKAFIDAGVANFPELYNQHHASDLFELLETGRISPAEFYNAFRKTANLNITDQEIETAWNAMLGTFWPDRLEWLKEIAKRYPVYLFSNTNSIHYDAIIHTFKQQTGGDDFNALFVKAYYSHELGLRKPYAASFNAILEEQQLDPAKTLFIDDTLKNIEGAKLAGLQTVHLVPPLTLAGLKL